MQIMWQTHNRLTFESDSNKPHERLTDCFLCSTVGVWGMVAYSSAEWGRRGWEGEKITWNLQFNTRVTLIKGAWISLPFLPVAWPSTEVLSVVSMATLITRSRMLHDSLFTTETVSGKYSLVRAGLWWSTVISSEDVRCFILYMPHTK